MRTAGIVAEYNPFHMGHAYQLSRCRADIGPEAPIFAVMSGDFVQRGEAASFDKFSRAEAACACGVNAVFELPLPWACATAEIFASGAVRELYALGVTDLYFGAENDSIEELEKAADILLSDEFDRKLKQKLSGGRSIPYAYAREQTFDEMGGYAGLLGLPNNILAVEYIKAVKMYCPDMLVHPIKRVGSGHDSDESSGGFLSAKQIRTELNKGTALTGMVPAEAEKVLVRELQAGRYYSHNDGILLSRLLMLKKQDFDEFAYCSGGLGNALYRAVHTCRGTEEVIEKVTGKTFARARVRRALTACVTGCRMEVSGMMPGYARLLAADERGRKALKEIRSKTGIPVITRAAEIRSIGKENEAVFTLCAAAHDLYSLCMADPRAYIPDRDWTRGPALLQSGGIYSKAGL